ncbi:sugar phosphate nucleotidyltransferase [Aestuariivirga sp. YIM B02566]|uniref:Mannose-1-phosphate guanylyltransferase/mannose-6-phosphate isomerase n=1 Tax=Taklimakanibacter albus TaxID=2800327 RepID=A0ACC5RDL0_9HYPH|nr:mannose-1-phosphate guanylyltransferase/mannose-6-phosphate isomerase [Aestuariivirga sp. YIM B02566]
MLITPLIVCGGAGTRLWPASRESRPKQFLSLFDGGLSTFQETVRRATDATLFTPPVIITHRSYRSLAAAQLDELGVRADILLEPDARASGPAILAGALFIALSRGNEAPILALAADHVIHDIAAFRADCRAALGAARSGHIVTFGIAPDRPATGYGYIEAGAAMEPGIRAVKRFVEKPDEETAALYVRQGYLWNSGNFLFETTAVIDAYGETDPATLAALREAVSHTRTEGQDHHLDATAFDRAVSLSFDYAVMEKTSRAAVVSASFDWSDVGSWATIHELSRRDAAGNAVKGDAAFVAARDNLVLSDGPLVALAGVNDLAVVVTSDAVLVSRRDDSSGVKKLVEQLKQHSSSSGHPGIRQMDLLPGERISVPSVLDRARHWLVLMGTAGVTIAGATRQLQKAESIQIPPEAECALENIGPGALRIVEIELPPD